MLYHLVAEMWALPAGMWKHKTCWGKATSLRSQTSAPFGAVMRSSGSSWRATAKEGLPQSLLKKDWRHFAVCVGKPVTWHLGPWVCNAPALEVPLNLLSVVLPSLTVFDFLLTNYIWFVRHTYDPSSSQGLLFYLKGCLCFNARMRPEMRYSVVQCL